MEFLEKEKTLTFLLIVASTMLGTIHSNSEAYRTRGRLMFEFIRYINPQDQTESGKPCSNICEPYFDICVGHAEDEECSFIQHRSKVYKDMREIVGLGQGPLIKSFTDLLPKDYYVKVVVREADGVFIGGELIRKFQMKIRSTPTFNNIDPSGENASLIEMTPTNLKPHLKIRLWIKLWSFCESNYYGSMCDILCQENEKHLCDVNGTKICKRGWSGRECLDQNFCIDEEKICASNAYCINRLEKAECFCNGKFGPECYANFNFCEKNPCVNGGQCILFSRNYTCECKDGFRGNHCEIQVSPCDSRPCQNGAECYAHASGNYICNCSPGFYGKQCENAITSTILSAKDFSVGLGFTSMSPPFNESVIAFGQAVTGPLNLAGFPFMVAIIASVTIILIATVIGVVFCSYRRRKRHIKEMHETGVYDYEEPMITANSIVPRLSLFKDRNDVPPVQYTPPSEQEQYILFSMQPVTYVRPPANENLYEECEPVSYPMFNPLNRNVSIGGSSGFDRSAYLPPNSDDRPSRSSTLPSVP